jgi:hypothetical protein
MHEALLSNHIS